MGSKADNPEKELTVLVTGFGPFKAQYPVNPSWQIARLLPDYLPPLRPREAKGRSHPNIPPVRILVHPEAIRVNYETVRHLVPKLWEERDADAPSSSDDDDNGNDRDEGSAASEGNQDLRRRNQCKPLPHGKIDIMIHIGMAGPRMFYQLERRGHRDGYRMADVDGKILEDTRKPRHGFDWIWNGVPAELETALNLDDVLRRWKDNTPDDMDLRISEDAGHYLCDFIYFSSLAQMYKADERRRVVFLHVPSDASDKAVNQGRELVVQLIRSIVESEVASKEHKSSSGGSSSRESGD